MEFWTDGSRVGSVNNFFIGWSAVCETGVLVAKSKVGGSNINAEIFAIRDLLLNLKAYRRKMVEEIVNGDKTVLITTDSKTSIQIIKGFQRAPHEYNVNESENYLAAQSIVGSMKLFEVEFGVNVKFNHIRGHENNLGNVFADYVATQQSNALMERCRKESA